METDKTDSQKAVETLNAELQTKYESGLLNTEFPEFEYKEFQEFFRIERDEYDKDVIYFQKMVIYDPMVYVAEHNNVDDVLDYCKNWFNNYIDSLQKLKF